MRRLAALLIIAALGCGALAGCTSGSGRGNQPGGSDNRYVPGDGATVEFPVDQRKPAPAISGTTLGGATYRLADHRGSVVVINFWASWCPPCRLEASYLEQAYQATKDSGVTFLGVNSRDGKSEALSFARQRFSYPNLFDPSGRVALRFGAAAPSLPSTLIIDRDGRLAADIHAPVQTDSLTDLIERIAAEPAAESGGD